MSTFYFCLKYKNSSNTQIYTFYVQAVRLLINYPGILLPLAGEYFFVFSCIGGTRTTVSTIVFTTIKTRCKTRRITSTVTTANTTAPTTTCIQITYTRIYTSGNTLIMAQNNTAIHLASLVTFQSTVSSTMKKYLAHRARYSILLIKRQALLVLVLEQD